MAPGHHKANAMDNNIDLDFMPDENVPFMSNNRKGTAGFPLCPGPGRFRAKYFLLLVVLGSLAILFGARLDDHPSPSGLWNSLFEKERMMKNKFCGLTQDGSQLQDGPQVKTEAVIRSPPTGRYRDALLHNQKYITSFVNSGWTNDVMAAMSLLRLALLTQRIPILPPFTPSHAGHDAGFAPFSVFFDIDFLSTALNTPILEWKDIKDFSNPNASAPFVEREYYGGELEEVGCWSTWMTATNGLAPGREGYVPPAIGLDISWTPAPPSGLFENSQNYNLHALADLAWSDGRKYGMESVKKERWVEWLNEHKKALSDDDKKGYSPHEDVPQRTSAGNAMEPDEQMFCVDFLYYTQTHHSNGWGSDNSDYWISIGRHVRWSKPIYSLAESYLKKAFSIDAISTGKLPPFVAVHIRRNDFVSWCYDVQRSECLAPLAAYAKRVEEVKREILLSSSLGLGQVEEEDIKVVVMSDEPRNTTIWTEDSEGWWRAVDKLGWKAVDHDAEETVRVHGMWYPSVLDAAMMSIASGFVGTDRSTFSLLAAKRVHEWSNGPGPTRMVKWGQPGADDH